MKSLTKCHAYSVFMPVLLFLVTLFSGVRAAQAHVDAAACVSSGPSSGAYVLNLCIEQPVNNAVIIDLTTVTVSTQITGNNPGAWKLTAFLDGAHLLTDFQAPFTFDLSTQFIANGTHTLVVYMLMRDSFTSAPVTIQLDFQAASSTPPSPTFTPYSPGSLPLGQSFVVGVTGDGAGGETKSADVTNLIGLWNPGMFIYLGDVYEKGRHAEFFNWYDPPTRFFGRFRSITNPTIGNHEYENNSAEGYFDYWHQIPNYYSYNVAGWHFISLNSTSQFDQRDPGTPQYEWLVQDLAANTLACTAVYFHHPVLSIGPQGDSPELNSLWGQFVQAGVDIVLAGHDHGYQRWVPLGADRNPAPAGTTQFVVASGGHGVMNFVRTDSRVALGLDDPNTSYGALRLELNPKGAAFRYINTVGTILDSGLVPCSGASPDLISPTQPTAFNVTLNPDGQVLMSWNASYDDTGVAGYTVYRDNLPLVTLDGTKSSYVDVSAELNKTYHYTVDAFDLAGNRSTTPTAIAISTSTQAIARFNPVADNYVDGSFPSSNYGTRTILRTDASPDVRSYLRFNVLGINGRVTSAKLRIYSNNGSGTGYQLRTVTDHTWSETGMTYTNAPLIGNVVASSGVFVAASWVELDVTSLVQRNGQYDLALTTTSNTAISLGSREDVNRPELIVNFDSSLPPLPVPGTFVFNPTADAYVAADQPTKNNGFSPSLRTDNSPILRSYLRFTVQNIAGTVVEAKLRVYAVSGSSSGYRLNLTGSNWTESAITYSNAPAIGSLLNTSGAFVAGTWTEINVTPWVAGEGELDFVLTSTSDTGINYSSREAANMPELIIVTSDSPPPPTPGTFEFTPIGDTYVNAASPTSNYGTANLLRADASPDVHSYLRFNVQDTVGTVIQAKLQIYTNSSSNVGYAVHSMTDNTWTEAGTTYNNAPAFGNAVGISGAFAAGVWTEVDITPLISGNGIINLALNTTTSTAFTLVSREDTNNPPKLIIVTE